MTTAPRSPDASTHRAACRACGAEPSHVAPVGPVPTTHPGPFDSGEFRLLYCDACEVTYLDPLPTARDLRTLYQASVQFTDETYTDPDRVRRLLDYYGLCLDNHGLLPPPGGALLEVGAGLAWVARACKEREPRVHAVAQDVSDECAARCPWVDEYVVGSIEDVPHARAFDLISMTHVIEHLTDPRDVLERLIQRLMPGGRILVTAPYRPAAWRPGHGVDAWLAYPYLHVPAHIHYLSEAWFRGVAAAEGAELAYWCDRHDDGRAFEAVIERRGSARRGARRRPLLARLRTAALGWPRPLRALARVLWTRLRRRS